MSHYSIFCHTDSQRRAKTKTEENYFCHLKKCHNCMKFTQLVDNTQYIMALQKKIEAETEEGSLYATSQ